jgi:hypothetical protein
MPGGIGLANPQFPYKSYFDPIGEAAPSSYIYDVTTKNQFALRSFKDNVGNCFTDMVLMSDGADSTSTFRLLTNTPEGNAVERMAVETDGTISFSNVTQTTPVMYKISLQTNQTNVNDSTNFTKRDIFSISDGAEEKISNGGTYTITSDDTITLPSTGYWRVTGNFVFTGTGARIVVAVQPEIEGTASGEIYVSDYIRNESGHTTSSTFMSSVYNFIGNKQLGFQFARYGVADADASIVGSASFVLVEKL